MKILIGHDGSPAHGFQRMGLAKAFRAAGHDVGIWHINDKPAYDVFDEVEPDLFLGQTYNLSPSLIECIKERPALYVGMKASDFGPYIQNLDRNTFQPLIANEQEVENISRLFSETGQPNFLFIHYHEDYLDNTHGYWRQMGIPVYSDLLAADIFDFTNGKKLPEFTSDICFIGGYWPYKAKTLDKYVLGLCGKYRVKIFGNSLWPTPYYCGYIPDHMAKHALASASICLNVHELHSEVYGHDIIERPFKVLSNQCFLISDYVEGLVKLFPDEAVYYKNFEELCVHVDHFLRYPYEKVPYIMRGHKKVLDYHTYFDRAKDIFVNLNLLDDAEQVMISKKKVLEEMKLW